MTSNQWAWGLQSTRFRLGCRNVHIQTYPLTVRLVLNAVNMVLWRKCNMDVFFPCVFAPTGLQTCIFYSPSTLDTQSRLVQPREGRVQKTAADPKKTLRPLITCTSGGWEATSFPAAGATNLPPASVLFHLGSPRLSPSTTDAGWAVLSELKYTAVQYYLPRRPPS